MFFDHFIIPFWIGVIVLFVILLCKWAAWLSELSREDGERVVRGFFSTATIKAVGEVFMESLLHRKIWKVNPWLGFMHTTFALGWALLIGVGWVEAWYVLGNAPFHADVFFRFFDNSAHASFNVFALVMDLLLLLLLVAVGLAWFKRVRSRALGMRRTTKHATIDRLALTALWCIFPFRLLAESFTAAVKHNGGFLTGGLGNVIENSLSMPVIEDAGYVLWWAYSIVLGVFFVALPFSRYMHIFNEIPLIFLRRYGLRSGEVEKSFDNFQIQSCSRCGLCIDPCQLQKDLGQNDVQSVYYLRDRRYGKMTDRVLDSCLMCGACEEKCPVGIELNILRLNGREARMNVPADTRYGYLKGLDRSAGGGRVGYFAGCMTLLTPATLSSMKKIFAAAGEDVWWADSEGGACCGRPMKLAGEVNAACKMMKYNEELFRWHNITTLVTSCPICLKVFKEDYDLDGIEVLHHSEYMLRLVRQGRLRLDATEQTFTYHDPCELGRGCGIYEPPRELLRTAGTLREAEHHHADALCCGSSVANTAIDDSGQQKIGEALAGELQATGADTIVTSCPLCKKAIARGTTTPVIDISQVVAEFMSCHPERQRPPA